jgi:hypothetical protein
VPLTESFTILSVFVAFVIVGLAIGILAWPALGRTLLAYGLAARIPIASYPPPDEHARVVGRDRAVRCAVRNRRSGDRAAARERQ